jgi:hypothetical protein
MESQHNMSNNTFEVVSFSEAGETLGTESVELTNPDANHLDYFFNKFLHLSGDLELPLEDRLPGKDKALEYRIGSDRNGAYVLYYFHDEVIFASLILSGTDHETETELMQVFKFLLLDTDDLDEPTEEEIDAVLSSEEFNFSLVESRPAVFEVQLTGPEDESTPIEHVKQMNRALSAAFFKLDRPSRHSDQ